MKENRRPPPHRGPIMMEVPFHYQFKLIVIGDTMVGKSSLLKTFSEGHFGEMEPTVGVDFFSKIIEIKPKHSRYDDHRPSNSNQSTMFGNSSAYFSETNNYRFGDNSIIIKLQIWDTAGQERFKSIVTSYFRNSVGIILVYDVTNRESFEHLIDWLTEARHHVEPAPSPTLSTITQSPSVAHINHPCRRHPERQVDYPLTSTPNRRTTANHSKHNSRRQNSSDDDAFNTHQRDKQHRLDQTRNELSLNESSDLSFTSMGDRYSHFDEEAQARMAYLVLGCKKDLENQRQVSEEEGRAFAESYGFKFIETSSKTCYNIERAFQLLAEEIYDKIIECSRTNRLHRTASGGHLTFDGSPSPYVNEGIRLGPLMENSMTRWSTELNGVRLLEAQPVSGFLGGCC